MSPSGNDLPEEIMSFFLCTLDGAYKKVSFSYFSIIIV